MPVRFRPRVGPFVWSPSRRRGVSWWGAAWSITLLVVFLIAVFQR